MATTVNLRKLLHRKALESCTPAPVATAAGVFLVNDRFNLLDGVGAVLVAGMSSMYLYKGQEDAYLLLPATGIGGVFGAGSCGCLRGLGAMGGVFTQTALAGSLTTITSNRIVNKSLEGCRIRVVGGAGVGYDGTISDNTKGTNAVFTVTPASTVAFDATTQYQIFSGSLWIMNAGTTSVGFGVYDFATNATTLRSVTNLPTAWGTDGKLISTIGSVSEIATGTSTGSNTSTTLANTGKAWATNMWANYQVRITGGTGKGQIRSVASNTGTALTVSAAWAITPDATSSYSIEGNDDYMYLLGNNAIALYRFSVGGNAWTVLAPTVARGSGAAAGCTGNWIESCPGWDNETAIPHLLTALSQTMYKQNGRYIYSFRGGASSALDAYDISANAWINGITYGAQAETFTTGSCAVDLDGTIYLCKEATGRVFEFDVGMNRLQPLTTNTVQTGQGGTAVVGDKMFILKYEDGATSLDYLYMIRNSGADLVRMLLI